MVGRELDIEVAERVIGWKWNEETAWSPTGSRWARLDRDPWEWLPYYSTDIAAAWEVVEELRRRDGVGLLIKAYPHPMQFSYSACIPGTEVGQTAETAPLAICLTALQIVDTGLPT